MITSFIIFVLLVADSFLLGWIAHILWGKYKKQRGERRYQKFCEAFNKQLREDKEFREAYKRYKKASLEIEKQRLKEEEESIAQYLSG